MKNTKSIHLEQKLQKLMQNEALGAQSPATGHSSSVTRHSSLTDWAQRAREALAVPDEVARSTSAFSVDPAVIYRWRDEMADLIENGK